VIFVGRSLDPHVTFHLLKEKDVTGGTFGRDGSLRELGSLPPHVRKGERRTRRLSDSALFLFEGCNPSIRKIVDREGRRVASYQRDRSSWIQGISAAALGIKGNRRRAAESLDLRNGNLSSRYSHQKKRKETNSGCSLAAEIQFFGGNAPQLWRRQ